MAVASSSRDPDEGVRKMSCDVTLFVQIDESIAEIPKLVGRGSPYAGLPVFSWVCRRYFDDND